jgi:hypothetical protein
VSSFASFTFIHIWSDVNMPCHGASAASWRMTDDIPDCHMEEEDCQMAAPDCHVTVTGLKMTVLCGKA